MQSATPGGTGVFDVFMVDGGMMSIIPAFSRTGKNNQKIQNTNIRTKKLPIRINPTYT